MPDITNNTSIHHDADTANVIVTIYSAYKPGMPNNRGPAGLPHYCGVAGVSEISCRPEFFGLQKSLSGYSEEIRLGNEVGGLGQPPCRKLVVIELPNHVHFGTFHFANLTMHGLYSDFSSEDGMGPCVGVWCREAVIFEGSDYETAIDEAIKSGIVVYVPTKDGKREEISAKIVSVSDIY